MTSMSEVCVVDLTGLKCPMPIVHLARMIQQCETGGLLQVTADDPAFEFDVSAWCRKTGHELVQLEVTETQLSAQIRRRSN